MTPLAHRIVRNLTLPMKRRQFVQSAGYLHQLSGMHCFDCTSVHEVADDLWKSALKQSDGHLAALAENTGFLPAPKTWIEFKDGEYPCGYFLVEKGSRARLTIYFGHQNKHDERTFCIEGYMEFPLLSPDTPNAVAIGDAVLGFGGKFEEYTTFDTRVAHLARIYAFLALINTPRVVGRRQHMPHRGLEKKLVAARGIVGKFPLHAWTEIKLEINAPKDMSGDDSTESHLTGQRALHFCRAHLRVRFGKVEIVRSHWRGDASIGIKRSRYKLAEVDA